MWVSHVYICKYVCHTHVIGISLTRNAEGTGMGRIPAILLCLTGGGYVLQKPLETVSQEEPILSSSLVECNN